MAEASAAASDTAATLPDVSVVSTHGDREQADSPAISSHTASSATTDSGTEPSATEIDPKRSLQTPVSQSIVFLQSLDHFD